MSKFSDDLIIQNLHTIQATKHSKGFVCKCPNCQDHKKRMYMLWNSNKSSYTCYCHNCGYSKSFKNFLKTFYPFEYEANYDKYVKRSELFIKKKPKVNHTNGKRIIRNIFKTKYEIPYDCIPLDELSSEYSYVIDYVIKREIPKEQWKYLFFINNFKNLAKHHGYDVSKWIDEPRLIIAFYNENKEIIYLQGRSFNKDAKLKYITLEVNHKYLKIWGLDRINPNEDIYVTEGPIDSMFLHNSMAIAGSKISNEKFKELFPTKSNSEFIFVFDNEPNNKDVVKSILDKIKYGFSVVIWNRRKIKEKDINDMITINPFINNNNIMQVLSDNTYKGIRAKNKLKFWRI